jgi:YVTN family beta-propeller protein
MRRRFPLFLLTVLLLATLAPGGAGGRAASAVQDADHEVWLLDQADTTMDGGGTLYIYQGNDLAGANADRAQPEVIDLGGAARDLCLSASGTAPRRPHMIYFNSTHSHAVISFVTTGHVLVMDTAARAPVSCIDAGEQAHAAVPAPDDTHIVVANQNGKLLQRIRADYASSSFTLEDDATLNLATCTTPSGAACQDMALRPDNAPICPIIDRSGRFTFVTLRGGGLLVVDATATPMTIVAEYDNATIKPNGCGGMETGGKMYVNSGGGTAATPTSANLYAFEIGAFSTTPGAPNTPAPKLVFSHDDRRLVDSHGAVLTRDGRYLWVADRFANRVIVVDTETDEVVEEIGIAGDVSGDPAPDLMDISPTGNRVYVALRGPAPLTANVPMVNNSVGSTPGLGIMRVEGGGRRGELVAVAPVSRMVEGQERADPHGIGVRRK